MSPDQCRVQVMTVVLLLSGHLVQPWKSNDQEYRYYVYQARTANPG